MEGDEDAGRGGGDGVVEGEGGGVYLCVAPVASWILLFFLSFCIFSLSSFYFLFFVRLTCGFMVSFVFLFFSFLFPFFLSWQHPYGFVVSLLPCGESGRGREEFAGPVCNVSCA